MLNIEQIALPIQIPQSLRNKSVSSLVSREIFFIDCINDLNNCAQSNIAYNLLRSSVLLRMLLLDRGLETISQNHNFNLELIASELELPGNPLSKPQVRALRETLLGLKSGASATKALELRHKPSKKYTLENFNEKICLTIIGNKTFSFSVRNIIEIVANKNGAAHLEPTFDSSGLESFHLDDYTPFSMTNSSNFFLKTIKEIIMILVEAVNSLLIQIEMNLINYNNSISQAAMSTVATLVNSKEEFDKLNSKK